MKKKNYLLPIIVLISVAFAYSLYVQMAVNTDDATTYAYMYGYLELGAINLSWKDYLNPWFLCAAIAYILNIGGTGATISLAYLAAWYGIAVFLTLVIINNVIDNKWLLAMACFILVPYAKTNRYHMFVTIVTLFVLWCVQLYSNTKNKRFIIMMAVAVLYTLLFANDKALLILFVFATAMVYYGIVLLQDKSKHKMVYVIAFAVVFGATIIKCIDNIFDLGISGEWSGYGGSEYLTWINVETLFDKGIPSFFNSLLIQWNVPASGGMIQLNSLYWIVRICIVILAMIAVFIRWIEVIKIGVKNMDITDALSVICFTVVAVVNIFNGMAWYYELSSTPMNRYASICWYLLVIILVRWIDQKWTSVVLYKKISNSLLLGIIFVMLSVGYISPIFKISDEIINSACLNEINFLKENGDAYKYGIASSWKSTPITAATNHDYVVESGWISDSVITAPSYSDYYDGTNYYNFIISDPKQEMTVSSENIEEIRGDYIGTYSNTSIMYLYDYDIRFDEKIVMECVSEDYEITEDLSYYLEFPVGTNRIDMIVGNSSNFDLSIDDNPDISEYSIYIMGENEIYVDLVCTQNTSVKFNVKRVEDELTTIHKISLKRVRASITIDESVTCYNQEIYLNAGSYVITFDGKDIKNMQVDWEGTDIGVEQLTDGRIKRRYQINVPSNQTVLFNISDSDNIVIDKISYENAELFDEVEKE
jgi:hypothetical protein